MTSPNSLDIELHEKLSLFWNALFLPNGKINIDGPYDEFAIWGAYGSGKTMVVLLSTFQMCQEYDNLNVIIIRETYSQLDDTIIHDFNKMFEGIGYSHKEAKKEIHFPNGSKIKFRAFDQPEKILGGSIDVVIISQAEQIPAELFSEIFGRQRGKSTLPKKILITEGNPSECWAKTRYVDNPLLPNIFYIQCTTFDNKKFLDQHSPKFIPNMLANLTENQIRRCLYGEWSGHDEMVFSNFNEQLNTVEPFAPKEWYFVAIGADYGWIHPTALIWGCVDEHGNIIIWDEFYESMANFEKIADNAKRNGLHTVVLDYATKARRDENKTVWTELADLGLPLVESTKDELRDIVKINQLFKNNKLYIMRNCRNLIHEVKNLRWKKRRMDGIKVKEEPVDKENDAVDALRYLVAYIEDLKSRDPEAFDYTKSIEYHTHRQSAQLNQVYIGR